MDKSNGEAAIAVVSVGIAAPGVNSAEELWSALQKSESQLGEPCRFDIDPIYSLDPESPDRASQRLGGYIRDFRPHPRLAAEMDRGQWQETTAETLWIRHSLMQALDGTTVRRSAKVGYYMATHPGAFLSLEESLLVDTTAHQLAQRLTDDPGLRIVHRSRLRELLSSHFHQACSSAREARPEAALRRAAEGLLPQDADWLTASSACASALTAIDIGVRRLLSGECEVAFCGAFDGLSRFMAVAATKFRGLSAQGDVRALDAGADGTLFSEAATMLVLKRLSRAKEDGDRILGILGGIGLACDGHGKSIA
ncbi:beta-ketoacyl synthase N-terminal-like domain-containing protein, partial [Streptomyces chryseus]